MAASDQHHRDEERERREGLRRKEDRECGRHLPTLPKLMDAENVDAFLFMFEKQMLLYEVAQRYWVSKLTPLLDGSMTRMVLQLPPEDQSDFCKVKAALVTFFGIDERVFRVRWNNLRMKRDETVVEVTQRALMFFTGRTEKAETKEQQRVLIVMEKVIQVLPEQINPTSPLKMAEVTNHHISNREKNCEERRARPRMARPTNVRAKEVRKSTWSVQGRLL